MSENVEERRAEEWLKSQGYTDIRDLSQERKDPPDFEVENRIAVEVRRLNWMDDSDEGVETDENTLTSMIEEILKEVGDPPGGYKVDVRCSVEGALPKKEETQKIIRQAVDQLIERLNQAPRSEKYLRFRPEKQDGIQLRFSAYRSYRLRDRNEFQLLVVEAEGASRGWPSDSIDNINRCIKKKTKKIQRKIHCFPEWWLVLVPYKIFLPGSWEQDRLQTIRDGLVDTDPWSRIVVLNVSDCLKHVDLIEQPIQD